ncbi:MAG: DUF3592 domain-containing protein [Planctomycetes bacterium]|nr:DUF3592 domain-containing protein [Planctomycetota bacterium]
MPPRDQPVPSLWGVLVTLAFGLLMMLPALDAWTSGLPSRDWPTVTATVVASEVERRDAGSLVPPTQATTFVARLRFRFEHAGRTHETNSYDVGGARTFAAEADARALVARHPVGSTCTIYVDERSPGRSVVDPDRRAPIGYFVITGGVVLAFGLLLLASRIVRLRHARA